MTAISTQVRGDTPPPATEIDDNRLVDAEELRTRLFGANPPSARWIREQTKRGIIPSLKIGRLRWYQLGVSRAALVTQCSIPAKTARKGRL